MVFCLLSVELMKLPSRVVPSQKRSFRFRSQDIFTSGWRSLRWDQLVTANQSADVDQYVAPCRRRAKWPLSATTWDTFWIFTSKSTPPEWAGTRTTWKKCSLSCTDRKRSSACVYVFSPFVWVSFWHQMIVQSRNRIWFGRREDSTIRLSCSVDPLGLEPTSWLCNQLSNKSITWPNNCPYEINYRHQLTSQLTRQWTRPTIWSTDYITNQVNYRT